MAASAAITPVGTGHCIEFGTHKVLTTSTTMPGTAKYPDLIYEVCLFHCEAQRYRIPG